MKIQANLIRFDLTHTFIKHINQWLSIYSADATHTADMVDIPVVTERFRGRLEVGLSHLKVKIKAFGFGKALSRCYVNM